MSNARNPWWTDRSTNPIDAHGAPFQIQTQPVASTSLQQGDAAVPPSLNGAELLSQNNSLLKLWSIHTIGDTVTLCYDAACAPCIQYVEHLLLHMGTFGLPLEQVREVTSKAWPHLIETTQEEAARPLT
jgi:hypothetical protein